MPRSSRSPRKPALLSPPTQGRLTAYCVVAGAAGVTALALVPPCEAKIVYTQTNQSIGRDGRLNIDLNHDGIVDFTVLDRSGQSKFRTSQFLSVLGKTGNLVNCNTTFCGSSFGAAALVLGSQIKLHESRHGWLSAANMAYEVLSRFGSFYTGPWSRIKTRFLGVQFQINGETHFGWIRLSVKFRKGGPPKDRAWEVNLSGFAYETVPGKPITAGQTRENDETGESASSSSNGTHLVSDGASTLGHLALGAEAIALWRREWAQDAAVRD